MTDEPMHAAAVMTYPFWVSWYSHPTVSFTLHSPHWTTGYRDDQATRVAAVRASCENDAMLQITHAHDVPVLLEWRFVDQKPDDWSPFNDRFKRSDWMVWDDSPSPA